MASRAASHATSEDDLDPRHGQGAAAYSKPPREPRWELTSQALQRLLQKLDPDPQRAGVKYVELRQALVKFFEWKDACAPEEGADETLNRLARRFMRDPHIVDPRAYAYGIARFVVLEQARSPRARHTSLRAAETLTAPEPPPEPPLLGCLERCLNELPVESRSLILRYYADERPTRIDARRALARELGVGPATLRCRAQRLRDRLEASVRKYQARSGRR